MSISDVGTVKQDEQGFITPFLFFGGDAHNFFVQNEFPINGHYAIWLLVRTSQLKSTPPPSSGMTTDSAAQFKVYIQTQLRYEAIST